MRTEKIENHIFPFLWMRGEPEHVIRQEMEKIFECGIREVCVEARPHPDFCGSGWWHDLDIIIDEAEKRNMRIWILDDKHFPTGYANGLIESRYPERKKTYIQYSSADVFGDSCELTLNVKQMLQPTIKFWEIGKPFNREERNNNQFISMTALKFDHGNIFTEDTIDLSDTFDGEYATFRLPKGQWKVIVVYRTRTDGGDESYINLIDRVSAHTQIEGVYEAHYEKYGHKFGTVIAGFFSDEPQFGNIAGFEKDAIVGKKQMPLPWSDELEALLKTKYGDQLKQLLPYLWNSSEEMKIVPMFRFDYMDCVSRLYEQNFSRAIGNWCEEHGVEYIGHVVEDDSTHSRLGMGAAHYFRAMSGQHMAGIDCIGGQIVYGAPDTQRTDMVNIDGEFYHYLIGKLGASCAHLDPKKKGRAMCELFGAYGWKFGVRDMKYVLDHLLTKGINYLVPHAFSMADYPDVDCPPHFYARGNNPEFPYFVELMKYAEQMCRMFSGGRHIATAAVLYDAEAEWAGERMAMQKVGRALLEHQIDFDVVSTDMLWTEAEYYNTVVKNGKLGINEECFDVLIIPSTQRITKELAQFIEKNPQFPVWFVDALPEQIVNSTEKEIPQVVRNNQVVMLHKLAETLQESGYYDIFLKEECPYLSTYHYETDRQLYLLLNESEKQPFFGEICLPSKKELVIRKGGELNWNILSKKIEHNGSIVKVYLYPGESCVIAEVHEEWCNTSREKLDPGIYIPEKERLEEYTERMSLSGDWTYCKARAIDYPSFGIFEKMEILKPISKIEPKFAGVIRYEKIVSLSEKPDKAVMDFEYVYEVMTLWVNGEKAGTCIRPPYQLEIGHLLRIGENQICIEVATTPARDLLNYSAPPFIMSHVPMEPTGMFGEVVLIYKN